MAVTPDGDSATATALEVQSIARSLEQIVPAKVCQDTTAVKYIRANEATGVGRLARTLLVVAVGSCMFSATAPPLPFWKRRNDWGSTSLLEAEADETDEIAVDLAAALWRARDESFEDGMDSRLRRWLSEQPHGRGVEFVTALAALLEGGEAPPEPTAIALRWLSERASPEAETHRKWLFERSLYSHSPVVRDGAVIALQSVGDPSAVAALEAAALREPIAILRDEMEAASKELAPDGAVPAS